MLFSSKAETLDSLRSGLAHARVPDFLYFPVAEWESDPAKASSLLDRIQRQLKGPLAVRSSAADEDRPGASQAGRYRSVLNVPCHPRDLSAAIQEVAESLPPNPRHQILVQEMVPEVEVSGVLFTRDLSGGGPYYSVGYDDESGRTDSVTRGARDQKTLLLHHEVKLRGLRPAWLVDLLRMTRELQRRFRGAPLDLEFARSRNGSLFLLQVRPLPEPPAEPRSALAKPSRLLRELKKAAARLGRPEPGLSGSRTLLGVMPDWNPAELIGLEPRPLALSLFQALISDQVWSLARASMGYRKVDRPLLFPLAGRPYVDVRASFNSFLPSGLSPEVEASLVEAWLDRLEARPEFHDRVEFDVAQTVVDPSFDADYRARYAGILSPTQFRDYRRRLSEVTNGCLSAAVEATLARAFRAAGRLSPTPREGLCPVPTEELPLLVLRDLARCRNQGTLPFAVAARHAFIAEAILRSAVREGGWNEGEFARFKRGISSVAGRIRRDFIRVRQGKMAENRFLRIYGHLRPGLFDILSPRYDQRRDLFEGIPGFPDRDWEPAAPYLPDPPQLTALLRRTGLRATAREFLEYALLAIRGREWIKFRLSRCLSDALESLAKWGEGIGLSRDEVSWLTLQDIECGSGVEGRRGPFWRELVQCRRRRAATWRVVRLGPLIRSVRDLEVVSQPPGKASFVTRRNIVGRPCRLENRGPFGIRLTGRIACVESADPGFDWLFSRGIAGLVTKFGGSNSHMAIRCAEMSVPAAIGVGERVFETLLQSTRIELLCGEGIVRPLDA